MQGFAQRQDKDQRPHAASAYASERTIYMEFLCSASIYAPFRLCCDRE